MNPKDYEKFFSLTLTILATSRTARRSLIQDFFKLIVSSTPNIIILVKQLAILGVELGLKEIESIKSNKGSK